MQPSYASTPKHEKTYLSEMTFRTIYILTIIGESVAGFVVPFLLLTGLLGGSAFSVYGPLVLIACILVGNVTLFIVFARRGRKGMVNIVLVVLLAVLTAYFLMYIPLYALFR